MKPTRITSLLLFALAAGIVGFVMPSIWFRLTDRVFPVPWSATTALVIVALAIAFWAFDIKRRLAGGVGVKRVNAIVAIRTSALALAASRTGALVGGVYLGVALYFAQAGYLSGAVVRGLAQERIVASMAAVVASVLLVAAALWLETICRIRQTEDPTATDGEPDPGSPAIS